MKIGFIGLGIMGAGMAANIQKEYKELFVWNRTKEKAAELVKNGATLMDTPADVAGEADIVFTILTTPAIMEEYALGETGFLAAMKTGAMWIDCTTVNPSFTERMAAEAKALGVRFMDAPVAGSKIPARDGNLVFFAGGDEADVKEAQPLFDLMGRKTVHAGAAGCGSKMKVVVNLLLGQVMASFAETINFGRVIGLSEESLLDTILDVPVTPPIVKVKENNFRTREFEEEFPLEWMHKDLYLATVTAYENDTILPMGGLAKEIFGIAKKNGLGRKDFSAVFTVFDNL